MSPSCDSPDISSRRAFEVNVQIPAAAPPTAQAAAVAAMFGIAAQPRTLYRDFALSLAPGQITAIVGPSGSGKSVLLGYVARCMPAAIALDVAALARSRLCAVDHLAGPLHRRLELLSRCGLADAWALAAPARRLSGGQLYRLALAVALDRAARRRRPALILADEFAATLDRLTAELLCHQLRKLASTVGRNFSLLLATPRHDILAALAPDQVVVKPLGQPPQLLAGPSLRAALVPIALDSPHAPVPAHADAFTIAPGVIADYRALESFHYIAGPPAAHKRVYVVRAQSPFSRAQPLAPAEPFASSDAIARLLAPPLAAVLVVSPPVLNVRGRNLATNYRYASRDRRLAMRRLNAELECISRVVVHPAYRGCGLSAALVRHALAHRQTPLMEALAAMGAVHPFFELAGLHAYHLGPDVHAARLLSAADAIGLTPADLAAVAPVRRLLARRTPAAGFFAHELALCQARTLSPKRIARLADPLAETCRRATRQYVYYLGPQ